MSDHLELTGLRLVASIGLLPEERLRRQPIEVDVALELSGVGAETDELGDTVDYGSVCDLIADRVAERHVDLLERLAGLLADELLALGGVVRAEVLVRKLRPPVPHDLAVASARAVRP